MKDRRNYTRLEIHIPVIIFDPNGGMEYKGTISNISENGIAIDIKQDEPMPEFKKGAPVKLQFIDKVTDGVRMHTEIVMPAAHVVRIQSTDKQVQIGCVIKDADYKKYVTEKKFEDFYRKHFKRDIRLDISTRTA